MTSFWGNAIKSGDVQKYIKDCLSGAWIERLDKAIKEISNMR